MTSDSASWKVSFQATRENGEKFSGRAVVDGPLQDDNVIQQIKKGHSDIKRVGTWESEEKYE